MHYLAVAQDPSFYQKQDTWQESLRSSIEKLATEELPSLSLPDLGKEPFTVSAWIKTESEDGAILARAPAEGKWKPQGKVFFLRDGRPAFDVGWVGTLHSPKKVNDGRWHHVAMTGRAALTFYVDGIPVHRGDLGEVGMIEVAPDPEGFVIKIGYCTPDYPGNSAFEGMMDDVRLYGEELSPEEIGALRDGDDGLHESLAGRWDFEKGALDVSGKGVHGKVMGGSFKEGMFGMGLKLAGEGWITLPADGREAAKNHVWHLVSRDFTDEKSRSEMIREAKDGIWEEDWPTGSFATLAERYARATRDVGGMRHSAMLEIESGVSGKNDLGRVRGRYHLSISVEEACGSLMAKADGMMKEITYLDARRHRDLDRWMKYKDEVKRLSMDVERAAIAHVRDEGETAEDLSRLEDRLDGLHAKIPLTLPSGPPGPGRFGAFHTRLKYSMAWDEPWRVGPLADVVVRFDHTSSRIVFWRGTGYAPCWITEEGEWYGLYPISKDRQCRFSHVRIIESHEARAVVHWRHAPVEGEWADEYFYFYPDGGFVQQVIYRPSKDSSAKYGPGPFFLIEPGDAARINCGKSDLPYPPALTRVEWPAHERTATSHTKVFMYGPVLDRAIAKRSRLNPPRVEVEEGRILFEKYDPAQRAYVFRREGEDRPLRARLVLHASKESPVHNPVFVIKDWGEGAVRLGMKGEDLQRGKDFRWARLENTRSGDIVIWINDESLNPLPIRLGSVTEHP